MIKLALENMSLIFAFEVGWLHMRFTAIVFFFLFFFSVH